MKDVKEILNPVEERTLKFVKGFDTAVIGIDSEKNKVIYSVKQMILILKNDGYEVEDITEYLYYSLLNKDECIWVYDISEGI